MSCALKELDVLLVEDDTKLLASLHKAFEGFLTTFTMPKTGLKV